MLVKLGSFKCLVQDLNTDFLTVLVAVLEASKLQARVQYVKQLEGNLLAQYHSTTAFLRQLQKNVPCAAGGFIT